MLIFKLYGAWCCLYRLYYGLVDFTKHLQIIYELAYTGYMRTVLIASILLLTACGRPHGYQIGQCFETDAEHTTFYKIVAIQDDTYSMKLLVTNPPEEYKLLSDVFPLPIKIAFDEIDLDTNYIPIACPR